ncbi:MAG: ribonuclease P protein component [Defluviitaleaceae bacterium]|nr:ribonuclease P protein component [Defluviitaleaceae bacterium]
MPRPLVSLKKTAEFKRVFSRGKSAATPLFVLYAAKNDLETSRLGLSVGKKVGCAVKRNLVKRLVREFFKTIYACQRQEHAPENGDDTSNKKLPFFDFIVIARAPSGEIPRGTAFASVCESLTYLLKKLGAVS